MPTGDAATHVTYGEFYRALYLIWLFVLLVLADLLRIEWSWSTAILGAISFLIMVAYFIRWTFFSGGRSQEQDRKRIITP
jgi:hypothetical protein